MVSHISNYKVFGYGNDKTARVRSPQRGSALIISMLILLVMTIVGLSTMNTSIMSEKMAANNKDMIATFQAATSSNGGCIAEASPQDSKLYDRLKLEIKPFQNRPADLTPKTPDTIVKPIVTSYPLDPATLTNGECSGRILRQTFHSNSSWDLFYGYELEFTGTGVITGTNSRTVNVQGAVKGPFPAL